METVLDMMMAALVDVMDDQEVAGLRSGPRIPLHRNRVEDERVASIPQDQDRIRRRKQKNGGARSNRL